LLLPLPLLFLLVIPEGNLLFARRAAPQKNHAIHQPRLPHISPSTNHQKPRSTALFPQQKQGFTTSEFSGQIPTNATIEKAA
jgi:hypothetical protein